MLTGACDGVNRIDARTGYRVTELHAHAPTAAEAAALLEAGLFAAQVMHVHRRSRRQLFTPHAPWSWRVAVPPGADAR